jgi:hypothetical protein
MKLQLKTGEGIVCGDLPITNNLRIFLTFLKGAFTLANFAHDFALSLHVLLNKNYLFSLLNVQASAKLHAKSRQCKRTFSSVEKYFKFAFCTQFALGIFFIS